MLNAVRGLATLGQGQICGADQCEPAKIVWEGRRWELITVVGAFDPRLKEWGGPSYGDLKTSDAYFWAGFGTSSAIGVRKAGSGSMYFTTARDRAGAFLDGGKIVLQRIRAWTGDIRRQL